MPSWVITGANRGLGLGFLKVLSQNPENVVFGLVRDKAAADERMVKEGVKNVTIIQADITDGPALKRAAAQVSEVTGGTLNYLINNAAYVSTKLSETTMLDYVNDSTDLEEDLNLSIDINTIGVFKTINAFIPLFQATPSTQARKVTFISTGMADVDMIKDFKIPISIPYAVSKAATNMLIAKYHAIYASQGILFLSISPGLVDTSDVPQEPARGGEEMIKAFQAYAPHWKGAITPIESATHVLKVIDEKSLENNDGGSFISHWGNKMWL